MSDANPTADAESQTTSARVQAIVADCRRRMRAGETYSEERVLAAHPDLASELKEALAPLRMIGGARQRAEQAAAEASLAPTVAAPAQLSDAASLRIRCPHCKNGIELLVDTPFTDIKCDVCLSTFSIIGDSDALAPAVPLQTVGHFELLSRVGVGGFGTLWKAHDAQLDRIVAVKIPRRGQLTSDQAEQFLKEARIAAQLKHSNIVSVKR